MGEPIVAADATGQAGYLEHVVYVNSRDATQAFPDPMPATDAAIVAIIDSIGLEGEW